MSEDPRTDRLRALATRVVETVGGIPAVRTLLATLEVYDRAGGGLVAGGLAYSALIALVPGALLVASALAFLVADEATLDRIVDAIASAVPPLEAVARSALESVTAGAVPTTLVALLGLLWGSSRFYAALDYAFSRIFAAERRRNEVVRTLRGVAVTVMFVGLPIAALIIGSVASRLVQVTPADRTTGEALAQLATPVGSFVLFVVVVSMVYRFVPSEPVPRRAFLRPAMLVGLSLAAFAQLFTFIAPRLVGYAALAGPFVAVFAILAWLSISFNVLLLGASWTRVRALATAQPDVPPSVDPAVDDAVDPVEASGPVR